MSFKGGGMKQAVGFSERRRESLSLSRSLPECEVEGCYQPATVSAVGIIQNCIFICDHHLRSYHGEEVRKLARVK